MLKNIGFVKKGLFLSILKAPIIIQARKNFECLLLQSYDPRFQNNCQQQQLRAWNIKDLKKTALVSHAFN